MRRIALLAASALLLAGCSQVAALAPVGGDRESGVRYAANDLLLDAGIEILTAPVCVQAADKAVTCQGRTSDGQDIKVVSTAADQARMVLTVGSRTLYDGEIQAVLDKAMQP